MKTLTPKQTAEKLLSEMPIGNAKIYAANMFKLHTIERTQKYWHDVLQELNK